MNILVGTAGTVCTRSRPGSLTVIDNTAVALPATLSVTLKVTRAGPPAAVGVPLMIPVVVLKLSPAGKVPESIDQV
jgi:hypothetical protein